MKKVGGVGAEVSGALVSPSSSSSAGVVALVVVLMVCPPPLALYRRKEGECLLRECQPQMLGRLLLACSVGSGDGIDDGSPAVVEVAVVATARMRVVRRRSEAGRGARLLLLVMATGGGGG